MTAGRRVFFAALLVALPFAAARAQPTSSLDSAVFENASGIVVTSTNSGRYAAGTIHIPYSVSDLGENTAWIEVDLCAPDFADDTVGSATMILNPSCVDGYGRPGKTAQSAIINSNGSNASISGVFDLTVWEATVFTGGFPGTPWVIPMRVMGRSLVDPNAQPFQIGAERDVVVTVHGEPSLGVVVNFASKTVGPSPVDGTSGDLVTFRVVLANNYDSSSPYRYANGISTLTIPAPVSTNPLDNTSTPGLFVSATPNNNFDPTWFNDGSLPVLLTAFNAGTVDGLVNGHPTVTESDPGAGHSGPLTLSIVNLLSEDGYHSPVDYNVTYWLPLIPPRLDANGQPDAYPYIWVSASGHWQDPDNTLDPSQTPAAQDYVYLLPPGTGNQAILYVNNNQNNSANGHTTVDSSGHHVVAIGDNVDPVADTASWYPQDGAVLHNIQFQSSNIIDGHLRNNLVNPTMTWVLDADTEFDSLYTLYEYRSDNNFHWLQASDQSNWQLWWSPEQDCPEDTFEQTAGGVGPLGFETLPADLTQIRCVRWLIPTGQVAASWAYQTFLAEHLKPAVRDALAAHPGAFHFININARATLGIDATWLVTGNGPAFHAAGTSAASGPRQETFWNTEAPTGSKQVNTGSVGIGSNFLFYLEGPDSNPASYHQFTNLHFRDQLPPELEITGEPSFYPDSTWTPEYGSAPAVPSTSNVCTWTHNLGPGHPATLDCDFQGPIFENHPGTSLDSDLAQCSPFYPNIYGQGQVRFDCSWSQDYRSQIADRYALQIPVKVVGGANGQAVTNCYSLWSDNPAVTGSGSDSANYIDGYAGPVVTAAHPNISCGSVSISGSPEIVLTKSHPSGEAAVIGNSFSWDITYQAAGSATAGVSNFYVYDLLGRSPDGTFPSGCAIDAQFAGVAHISGNRSVAEYTTDALPRIGAGNWLVLPASGTPTGVTGVRFQPTSLFDSTPGSFSPNDPPGVEQVLVTVPPHAGMSMCNSAVQQFNQGGAPASVNDTHVQISDLAAAGGPYAVSTGASTTCGASVQLDGSGSNMSSNSTISWTEGGVALSSALSPALSFSVGVHAVTLTITSAVTGPSSRSTTVTVADTGAPTIQCPAPQSVPLDSGSCGATVQLSPTAQDNCAVATSGCAALSLNSGETGTLTCTATDIHGNHADCTTRITAASAPSATLTLGTPAGSSGANGAFCNDQAVHVAFTFAGGCGGGGQPEFAISYSDSAGVHPLPFSVVDTGGTPQTGTITVDPTGLVLNTSATVTATLNGRVGSAQFPLDVAACGPPCVNVLYVPSKGQHGMVLFEDLWPHKGDLDFNDLVVAYNYAMTLDAGFNVTALQATYNLLAAGATIHSALKLHLPGLARAAAASIILRQPGKSDRVLHADALENELVIPIVDDVLALFAAGPLVNTESSRPTSNAQSMTVLVQFASPLTQAQLGTAPFDLFITQSGKPGSQIHLPIYPGTQRMTPGLMNSADDWSNKENNLGLYFITKAGLPFGLVLPPPSSGARPWPQEKIAIDKLYRLITPWAQSGGTSNANWYDVNPDELYAYTGGDDGKGPPAPTFVGNQDGSTDLTNNACAFGTGGRVHAVSGVTQ